MACMVTPEEYMSRLLMPKSCTDGEEQEHDDEPGGDGALVEEGLPRPRRSTSLQCAPRTCRPGRPES